MFDFLNMWIVHHVRSDDETKVGMTIDVVQEDILIGLPRTSSDKHERCCVAILFSTRELFHKWERTGNEGLSAAIHNTKSKGCSGEVSEESAFSTEEASGR